MPNILRLVGASILDVAFALNTPGFPEIMWNITRIERDAFSGRFGPPRDAVFADLTLTDVNGNVVDQWRHLDRAKVRQIIEDAHKPKICVNWEKPYPTDDGYSGKIAMDLIDLPIIAVELIRDEVMHLFPIDGNHRMMAREVMGYKGFRRFVVPYQLEGEYRITMEEVQCLG